MVRRTGGAAPVRWGPGWSPAVGERRSGPSAVLVFSTYGRSNLADPPKELPCRRLVAALPPRPWQGQFECRCSLESRSSPRAPFSSACTCPRAWRAAGDARRTEEALWHSLLVRDKPDAWCRLAAETLRTQASCRAKLK